MDFWFCSTLRICKLLQNIVGLRLVLGINCGWGILVLGCYCFFVLEFQFDWWILRFFLKIKCSILNQMGGF
jgi:hypothetical protein